MTRDETVALFLQGRKAWNAWAEKMLPERKAIEAAGRWAAAKNEFGELEPENEQTRAWIQKTQADFFRCLFLARGAEGTKKTTGEEENLDEEARPAVKSIQLEAENIDFSGFIFPGNASFDSATFSGRARFESAIFSGNARFRSATFSGDARFESAIFSGSARFDSATFSGYTWFESAIFSGNAWFVSATFQDLTSYQKAQFEKKTCFAGIKVDRAFDMTGAKFKQVPAFNQADFKQAPDLDNVAFPLPLFWQKGRAELIAKYRAIRRMAIQSADYEREQMAFKGELRSRLWTTDKPWHFGTWFGLLYDGLADCGRSIVRPLSIWLAGVPIFAVLYLRAADQAEGWGCGTPFIKALFLSGRNALVLFSGGRDARIAEAYRCLYGGSPEPHIPDSVSFLEAFVQVPISAVLIFLLLLAVKNRFKIK